MRTYTTSNQLTKHGRQRPGQSLNVTYNHTAGSTNGKITSMTDAIGRHNDLVLKEGSTDQKLLFFFAARCPKRPPGF